MSATEYRVGKNEALFREVNERIRDVNEGLNDPSDYLCECGHAECEEHVMLTPAEYEWVRSDPCRFAIVPGHEIVEVETVIERHDRYAVVRKLGPGGAIAKETDTRA